MRVKIWLVLWLLLSSTAVIAQDMPKPAGVVHVVLVWLKEAGNTAQRQQIITASKQLKDIPGVLDLRVGEVIPSDRSVVDSSYDVALTLRFANDAALQAYLIHPVHKRTVKEVFMPIMDKFRVMDFRDQ